MHTAILSTDDISIVICCGQNNTVSFNDVAVLDTQNWYWTIPEVEGNGNAPSPRMAISSIFVNGQMIIFFVGGLLVVAIAILIFVITRKPLQKHVQTESSDDTSHVLVSVQSQIQASSSDILLSAQNKPDQPDSAPRSHLDLHTGDHLLSPLP
ncbi:hypothetical protein BC936DRAFT_148132 [Jimgerdemannia flammicorona]|uniref:Uncharacterized protein n=1 Tax=Jimgerdemannia flammicorona TaxID=994334 RepID=A0A433D3P9_9FUNG|nr:hypothetical protein BC936DRAFT_148132 [Jimgerdemannia flammicorona]